VWTHELDEQTIEDGVVCQAFDQDDFQIGVLALDPKGKILVVEVKPAHRRSGIATRMLRELEAAGYTVSHDWENMRDDGEAWARSLGAEPPAP